MRENGEYRNLLRRCLADSGLSQYRLADLSGVGPVTLNRILNGHRTATELQVLRLAVAMLMSVTQKRALNEHLDSAEFYTLPLRGDDDGPRILLPRD